MPVKLFFCYAQKDKKMLHELKKHLKAFQRNGIIETWCDQDISAGTDWEAETVKQLDAAHVILLLISADFMDSDYCYSVEMKRAIERHERGEARVIPIILRPVYWQHEGFSKLQPLPTEGKPIIKWSIKDDAFLDITEGLADVLKELLVQEEQIQSNQLREDSPIYICQPGKQRALLVLAGGRPSADVLIMRYLQPQLIVVIAPPEWAQQTSYLDIAKTIPSCAIRFISISDAYDIRHCAAVCYEICQGYPFIEWEWVITISSAPKTMGLAGYEVAKQLDIPCLQVDFLHERVLSLVKGAVIDEHRLFRLNLDQYMSIYGYKIIGRNLAYDALMKWGVVARDLVFSPDTEALMGRLRGRDVGAETLISHKLKETTLLQSLTSAGLLGMRYDRQTTDLFVRATSSEGARFLSTDAWLISYVWQELQNANFADDCQANLMLQSGQVRLEIDLALVYRSRLLIAECCAPRSVLGLRTYLERLDSTAHLVGGEAVSKVLIINQPSAMHSDSNRYYDAFWELAKQRQIVVVTKEDLPNIAAILKREMTTPTYARV